MENAAAIFTTNKHQHNCPKQNTHNKTCGGPAKVRGPGVFLPRPGRLCNACPNVRVSLPRRIESPHPACGCAPQTSARTQPHLSTRCAKIASARPPADRHNGGVLRRARRDHTRLRARLRAHMPEYAGPPPPSGTTQSMFCEGHLMSHVLQWMQFCALICSRGGASSSRMYS